MKKYGKNLFALINGIFLLLFLLFYNEADHIIMDTLFGVLLLLYSLIFGFIFKTRKLSWQFIILLVNVGWIFILMIPSHYFLNITYLITLNLFPILLYIFSFNFFSLNNLNIYKKLIIPVILVYICIFILLLFGYDIANISYLLSLLILFFIIIFTVIKNRYRRLKMLNKYYFMFIIVLLIIIVPTTIIFLFPNFFSEYVRLFSLYSIIGIPIFFSYVMWEQDETIRVDLGIPLAFLLALFILGFMNIVLFSKIILNMTILNILIISDFTFVIICIMRICFEYVLSKRIASVNLKNLSYEFEQVEYEYEHIISTSIQAIANLIEQFCEAIFDVTDIIICSKEGKIFSLITQTGVFNNQVVDEGILDFFANRATEIVISNIKCSYETLVVSENQLFYVIVGKENIDLSEFVPTFELLLQSINKLQNEKNLYSKLPYVNYSDVAFNMYSNEFEKSQKYLAEYLHDSVLQNVISLIRSAEQISIGEKKLDELINECRIIINSLRNETFELYPTLLNDTLIYQVVQELINRLKNNPEYRNIEIFQIGDALLKLPSRLQYSIYRVVKELLQNACKHAKATKIQVKLKRLDNYILIKVEDNGIGITNDFQFDKNKYGLLSIKQTVKQLNGKMTFFNNGNGGATVVVMIELLEEEYYVYIDS